MKKLTQERKQEYLAYAQKRWPKYQLVEVIGRDEICVIFANTEGKQIEIPWF